MFIILIDLLNKKCNFFDLNSFGEVAEWFKAHAWKVCVLLKVPWVRIPLSLPSFVYLK
jgi:hypothetical protein